MAVKKLITKKTKGIITDLSSQDYHNDRLFKSSSVLKTALTDPLEYYQVYVEGKPIDKKNQDALNLGSYLHTVFLEPEKVSDEFAIFSGPRRAGAAWEQFAWQNRDKIIITDSQQQLGHKLSVQFAHAKVDMGNKSLLGPQLFHGGRAEESFFCELNGMRIKTRTDYRIEDSLIIRDLKTTNQTPNSVEEAKAIVDSFGYDLSAALYVDVMKEITGKDYEFQLVFLSKTDFKTNVYRVSDKTLALGRAKYLEAIELIKSWEATGEYHAIKKIREV